MSRSPRVLFVSYGGGHIGMVLPVIRELEALIPAVQCELMALTTGHLKAKAIRPEALGYKDFLHLVDREAACRWGERLSEGNTSPDVPMDETVAYLGINYLDLIAQFGEAGAAERYRSQGRYGFQPLHFMRKVIEDLEPDVVVATNSPRSERAALDVARSMGLPCIGMVDLFGLDSDTYVTHACKPDWTCVISEGVRQRLIRRGFPASGVVVTGNPEDVLRQHVRQRDDLALIVRYHPSDWTEYPRLPDEARIHFSEPPREPIHPLILASSVVVVQTSTVGLESAVGGRPVISVENSPAAYVWFSLARQGVSSPAATPSDLPAVVDAVLAGEASPSDASFRGDGRAAQRVASLVRSVLGPDRRFVDN